MKYRRINSDNFKERKEDRYDSAKMIPKTNKVLIILDEIGVKITPEVIYLCQLSYIYPRIDLKGNFYYKFQQQKQSQYLISQNNQDKYAFLIINMNKINLKNKRPEEFTPWEESFIDLANTFHKNQANNPPRRLYLSIDQKAHHCHRYHDNIQRPNQEQIRKPVLNTSKVNLLKNNNYKEMPYMIRNESKRFEGPRLTFYSKMNPKCNDHSRDKFKNNQRSEEKHMFSSNNFNKTMFRDESIKYLNIIEQKQKYEQRTHVEKGNEYEGNSNLTAYLKMIFLGKEKGELMNVRKKDDEHNSTMKRLKLLYNQKRYTSIMH